MFDLFKLHEDKLDRANQSWICFNGPNLDDIVNKLSNKLIKRYNLKSKKELCSLIAKIIKSKTWTIEQVIYNHKKWIPIVILKTLIYLSKNKNYKKNILKGVKYIKCNSSKSRPITAIKNLNLNLCKIAGAHTADGNISSCIGLEIKDKKLFKKVLKITKKYDKNKRIYLTRDRYRINIKTDKPNLLIDEIKNKFPEQSIKIWFKYGINLTEGYYKSTLAYKNWIDNTFGTNVKLRRHGTKNAWRIDFDNKIIARYLIKFFNFPAGPKTFTVKEPEIIKNSNLRYRKAFLLGLMTFEGYSFSKYRKTVGILIKNKYIINSVNNVLKSYDIPLRKIKEDNYGRWACDSKVLKKEEYKLVLNLFEQNTEKWNKINDLLK